MSSKYGSLIKHFGFYGAYHNNVVNQWIHIICVPLIFTTALIFLSPVSIASYVPSAAAKLLSSVGAPLTAALPAAIAYAIFYLAIAPFGLGFSMATLVFAQLAAATHLYSTYGGLSTFMPAAIGVHVVSWIAQFYGHGVHEGRAPALLDNLFQAIFMAPLFVFIEVLFKLGLLIEFKKEALAIVEAKIAEFRAAKAKNS